LSKLIIHIRVLGGDVIGGDGMGDEDAVMEKQALVLAKWGFLNKSQYR